MMTKSSIGPVLSALFTLSYNVRTWYRSSRLLALDGNDLNDQVRLTALRLASIHPSTINYAEHSEEAVSKEIYSLWYNHLNKQPTLSQLALKNER